LLERADRFPLNDHQKDRIGRIRSSGTQLLTLINGVLDHCQDRVGKAQLSLMTFDFAELVDELRGIVEVLLKDKPAVSFALDLGDGIPEITSDRDKLRRILVNLLSNAGQVHATRKHHAARPSRRSSLALEVADSGVGIPPQYVQQVFEKFFQVPGVMMDRSLKGSGLGLAICKSFAEMLGGTLTVQSTQWQGSTFTLTVPLVLQVPDIVESGDAGPNTLDANL